MTSERAVEPGEALREAEPEMLLRVVSPTERELLSISAEGVWRVDPSFALSFAQAVAPALLAAARGEPGLDVERLARALNATMDTRANIAAFRVAPESLNHAAARLLAAEYNRLATPTTPEPEDER